MAIFLAFQKQTNSFTKRNNSKPLNIQNGLAQNNSQIINVKVTSFVNSPLNQCHIVRNGAWIGKLEKEVLHP